VSNCQAKIQAELQNNEVITVASGTQDLYDVLIEEDIPSYDADTSFIQDCMKRGDGASPFSGNTGIPAQGYCQCELNETKGGKSLNDAQQACMGVVPEISMETQSIYHKLSQPDTSQNTSIPAQLQTSNSWLHEFVQVVGSGFAIMLGIASFVSGLLGWLLVMKKRVLQCSVCRATISTS
jgi:hypothetical protein